MTNSAEFVRKTSTEKYNAGCIVGRVKHPASVMEWGCISAEGPGPLYFVEGMLRQEQYINILRDVFLPYLDRIDPTRQLHTFMQDGAPCHTSKKVNEFMQKEKILVLPWPGNSPDMNPIENCWARLKSLVYSRVNTNVSNLKENILDVWENDQTFKNLVVQNMQSMPNRITALRKAKGGATKY